MLSLPQWMSVIIRPCTAAIKLLINAFGLPRSLSFLFFLHYLREFISFASLIHCIIVNLLRCSGMSPHASSGKVFYFFKRNIFKKQRRNRWRNNAETDDVTREIRLKLIAPRALVIYRPFNASLCGPLHLIYFDKVAQQDAINNNCCLPFDIIFETKILISRKLRLNGPCHSIFQNTRRAPSDRHFVSRL